MLDRRIDGRYREQVVYRIGMPFTTLIRTGELAAHLSDPAFVVIDCRFDLGDTAWGERAYSDGHIQGAVYAHLDRDLSGVKTGTNGRHPLPDPETLAQTFGRLGVADGRQVIAYDQDAGMYASRLWWELRWLGHAEVAVLDGGWAKWVREGRETASGAESKPLRAFEASPREDMLAPLEAVEHRRADRGWRLLDARAPERFRGENETIDKVAGHIPGAENYFFKKNLNADGTFKPEQDLREQLIESAGGVSPDRIICYCGSGVTACHNLLAMEHAGLRGAKLYVGSWSEWSADPNRPTESKPSTIT